MFTRVSSGPASQRRSHPAPAPLEPLRTKFSPRIQILSILSCPAMTSPSPPWIPGADPGGPQGAGPLPSEKNSLAPNFVLWVHKPLHFGTLCKLRAPSLARGHPCTRQIPHGPWIPRRLRLEARTNEQNSTCEATGEIFSGCRSRFPQ